jgi:hypothetical protein
MKTRDGCDSLMARRPLKRGLTGEDMKRLVSGLLGPWSISAPLNGNQALFCVARCFLQIRAAEFASLKPGH